MHWIKIPDPQTTRNKPATKMNRDTVARDVLEHPDAYQYGRAQRRLEKNYKKTLQNPRVQSCARCIYIDESGFAHDMLRTHGYALRALRCFRMQVWHTKDRTNAIGALSAKSYSLSDYLRPISMPIFLPHGCSRIYGQNCQKKPLSSWIMQPFINDKIHKTLSEKQDTHPFTYRPILPILISSSKNELKPKPSERNAIALATTSLQ
jgi:hypothetical protein